jgi:CRP/FNR family transcriptional regulator, nitrogen oxide reductase regulator
MLFQMNTRPHITGNINNSVLFNGLAGDQIAELIKIGSHKHLPPQSILFHQADPAVTCFMVIRGRLKLTKLNDQGQEVIIRYIDVGEVAAAVAVLKNSKYPVTAQSIEKTEVIGWDKPTMIRSMRQYPDIAINLLGILLARLDEVQDRYLELCTEQADRRIARSLLRFMQRAGIKTEEGIHIDIPLSRQTIAEFCGTTLFTVSRTLSTWEKNGWIKSSHKKILITNPHALVLFAEAE